jgi:hypothetical protein
MAPGLGTSYDAFFQYPVGRKDPLSSPTTWPMMRGDMVWEGSKFPHGAQYTYHLTATDIVEADTALSDFKGTSPY